MGNAIVWGENAAFMDYQAGKFVGDCYSQIGVGFKGTLPRHFCVWIMILILTKQLPTSL